MTTRLLMLWTLGTTQAVATPTSPVCADRAPCRVAATHTAGATQVLEVVLADASRDHRSPSYGEPCVPWELWSVTGTPPRTTRLAELCNDGYGASGVGSDEVSVATGPGTFCDAPLPDTPRMIHAQHGGSSWRWSTTLVHGLDPVRRLAEGSTMSQILRGLEGSRCFNHVAHVGHGSRTLPRCDAGDDPTEGTTTHAHRLIPQVAAPAGWDWRQVGLGACAASVDGSGAGGHVVHGKPGTPADASLRAAVVDDHLFVEVDDDRFVDGSGSWLHDDHVELWLGDLPECQERGSPVQVALTFDGRVVPAHGEPPSDLVGLEVSGRRMRIQLPDPRPLGITVVYSDSDDGRTQERLLATSALTFGDAGTLGEVFPVDPEVGRCVVGQSTLAWASQPQGATATSAK